MPLLNFNFAMIYIIYKMLVLVLIKDNLNYLKDSIFECFFKEYNVLNMYVIRESLSLEKENIIKEIRNLKYKKHKKSFSTEKRTKLCYNERCKKSF